MNDLQSRVDEFNSRYPVGTPVLAYPGCLPEHDENATRLLTRTRSRATVLSGHTPVVWVDGHSACIALTHIDPFQSWDTSAEASAARWVPSNPRPLCRGFQQKPDPAASLCATCGWNEDMHGNEVRRTAIAKALECLPNGVTA